MEDEVVTLELDRAYSGKDMENYHPLSADTSLDLTISSTHTLDDAIQILQNGEYKIKSVKPKSGRLEEFFLKSTKK